MSEALILESVNPQYDERLFIELQEKYKFRTSSMRASEKDLPVLHYSRVPNRREVRIRV